MAMKLTADILTSVIAVRVVLDFLTWKTPNIIFDVIYFFFYLGGGIILLASDEASDHLYGWLLVAVAAGWAAYVLLRELGVVPGTKKKIKKSDSPR
jgi:hypothetical protein